LSGVVSWFARNPIAANLLMVMILVLGTVELLGMKEEVFPDTATGVISITVPFPGAAPEEVEEGICVKIEEAIQDLDGIDELTSVAAENLGSITVVLDEDQDARESLDDIKSRIDALETLPEAAEEPLVQELIFRRHVVNIAIYGDADEMALRRVSDRILEQLIAETEVSQAELTSARPYEVSIELSEESMRRYGLTFDQVSRAVAASSLDLPGGSIDAREGDILVRTVGQRYRGEEFAEIPVVARPDGTRLRVGDVARVVDGFAETDKLARFNDLPAVQIRVYRSGDQDATAISAEVERFVATAAARVPEGIRLAMWQDNAKLLKSRLDLLKRNAAYGLGLVFVVLALFLRLRLALWISLGIGVSFFGTFLVMPWLGASMNMITAFGFIVVLGIVVDDAIVVGESIFHDQENGKPGLAGAISGARRVTVPVIFAVSTTIVAFWPLMMIPGAQGKLWSQIPYVVIPTLAFSIIESLWILPAHLRHQGGGRPDRTILGWAFRRAQGVFGRGLERFTRSAYLPSLELALRQRYLTVAAFTATLLLVVGVIGGGHLLFSFMPDVEADYVVADITMPRGATVEQTAAAVSRLEAAAEQLRRELDAEDPGGSVFRNVLATVGEQPNVADQRTNAGGTGQSFDGSHLGEVNIELAPSEERGTLSSEEIAKRWRALTGPIPGAVELTFTASLFTTGHDVDVLLTGEDLGELRRAADRLGGRLAAIPGVHEVSDSLRSGKEEMRLSLRPEAEQLGLTLADLARQVRQGFHGEEADRIQRGRDDVKVMVRYPLDARRSTEDLEEMRIRTPAGAEVPFRRVAAVERARGIDAIERYDRLRGVHVRAMIDGVETDPELVFQDLTGRVLPELEEEFPRIGWKFEGEKQEQAETLGALGRGFILALLAIYALMAVPFRSWLQPLIIMSAIPFGIVGAALGHLLLDLELSTVSLCGVIALSGVVVNDNLVLVDTVNRRRREGLPLHEALRSAGASRLRPILLTSLTTFAGLTPLLLERSLQAKFMVPMAVSLGFGVLFATFISLILVPVTYRILEDLFRLIGVDERWIAETEEQGREALREAGLETTRSW